MMDDLQEILTSEETRGIEGIFGAIIYCLKYLFPAEWILILLSRDRSHPFRYRAIDLYVIGTTVLSMGFLYWDYAPLPSALVASYFLVGTIVNMANVVFLTKLFGPPISNERTLLLFILNVAQLVVTYAIWYRFMLGLQADKAFFNAMLVFGTIGYPQGADLIVGFQIGTDFFLLAIFLAFILSNVSPSARVRRRAGATLFRKK
jgi:hypothetical protein